MGRGLDAVEKVGACEQERSLTNRCNVFGFFALATQKLQEDLIFHEDC